MLVVRNRTRVPQVVWCWEGRTPSEIYPREPQGWDLQFAVRLVGEWGGGRRWSIENGASWFVCRPRALSHFKVPFVFHLGSSAEEKGKSFDLFWPILCNNMQFLGCSTTNKHLIAQIGSARLIKKVIHEDNMRQHKRQPLQKLAAVAAATVLPLQNCGQTAK